MLLTLDGRTGGVLPQSNFPAPVVGSLTDDNLPTSADVHLYADPSTYATQYPVLFADCEGLSGGLKEPLAVQIRQRAAKLAERRERTLITRTALAGRTVIAGKLRKLDWSNDIGKKGREFAVTQFYPRILYTFSDVVVFVTRNPK